MRYLTFLLTVLALASAFAWSAFDFIWWVPDAVGGREFVLFMFHSAALVAFPLYLMWKSLP